MDEATNAWDRLKAHVGNNPQAEEGIERLMALWAEYYYEPEARDGAIAYQMYRLTGSDEWASKVRSETPGGDVRG